MYRRACASFNTVWSIRKSLLVVDRPTVRPLLALFGWPSHAGCFILQTAYSSTRSWLSRYHRSAPRCVVKGRRLAVSAASWCGVFAQACAFKYLPIKSPTVIFTESFGVGASAAMQDISALAVDSSRVPVELRMTRPVARLVHATSRILSGRFRRRKFSFIWVFFMVSACQAFRSRASCT
jgi:hypothetical protein